jgi:hypothetical protein
MITLVANHDDKLEPGSSSPQPYGWFEPGQSPQLRRSGTDRPSLRRPQSYRICNLLFAICHHAVGVRAQSVGVSSAKSFSKRGSSRSGSQYPSRFNWPKQIPLGVFVMSAKVAKAKSGSLTQA